MLAGRPSFELAELAPAIRWWMWIAIALLLVIARFLPVKLPRRTVGLAVCGALAVAAVSLHVIVQVIRDNPRIERTGTFDPLIAELARTYRRDRPTLLIIGSSRSTLGLDGAALEQKLGAELGRDLQVLQFSSTGHYALEQLYTTRRLLDRLQPERLTVLVELGTEIDLGVPEVLEYTTRGLDFFDVQVFLTNLRLWRAARAGNANHPAYSYRLLARSLSHTAQHHLGIGLLFDLAPASPPGKDKGFAPNVEVPADAVVQRARESLATSAREILVASDKGELIAMVRAELADEVRARVPGKVDLVFFVPPTADPVMRAEAPLACAAVAHLGRCFHMSDEEVRAQLPAAGNWMDVVHLTAPGAANFTTWLAARLAAELR